MSSFSPGDVRRWSDIESEIQRMMQLPQSAWMRVAENLKSETLVFLVRQIRDGGDEKVFTKLITELCRRIVHIVSAWIHFPDETTTKDLVDRVQVDVLQVILQEKPEAQSRFLETGFAKAVKRRAIDAYRKYKRSVQDRKAGYPVGRQDDGDDEIERPIEQAPDPRGGPESQLLAKVDKAERERLYRRARRVIKNRRQWRAIILFYVEGWPKAALVKEFGESEERINHWLRSGMAAMQEAIGVAQ